MNKLSKEPWKAYLPYLAIGIIILVFNILSIWGFDGLIIDDQGYYFRFYYKTVDDLHFRRNIIHALFTLGIIKLATISSVYFARLIILLLFSIPSAFLIYYFSRNEYHLKKHASIAIAVLPFILPDEVQVPTYLVGSYMLPGLLTALISIWFILKYSRKDQFSAAFFVLSAVFYYFATECTELLATMLPAFLFLVFAGRKLTWKQIMLGAALTFIAVRKSYLIYSNPFGKINNVGNDLSFKEILFRISHFPDFINPLYGLGNIITLNIIVLSIIFLGFVLVTRNRLLPANILDQEISTEKTQAKSFNIFYRYLFPIVWIAFSSVPFLVFSQYFTSRYFMIASVAFGILLLTSAYVILSLFTSRKTPFLIISVLVILISGISRQVNFNKYYKVYKTELTQLEQPLLSSDFPEKAQFIIASPDRKLPKYGYGVIDNSNGIIQYIMKRRDVSGQIMAENCFYDPFQIYNKPHKFRNADIDTTKNTFIFRFLSNDPAQNRRLFYAMRWVDENSKDSPWTIFHFNEQGKAINLISGNGYDDYESVVDSMSALGIKREDIMFGGIPNRNDSLRLGL